MAKPKSEYSIQTVSNALRLLEAFDQHDELGVSELARRLDLHKNNVFRLLATQPRDIGAACTPQPGQRRDPCARQKTPARCQVSYLGRHK